MQKVVLASGSDFDYAKLLSNPKLQLYTVRLPDNVSIWTECCAGGS